MEDSAAPDEIAIFPLENVVLFPKVQVPLFIFEPRYRQMTQEALAGSRRLGMVAVRPEFTKEMLGNPPVFPIGCEGAIENAEELSEGRFSLVLTGLSRFRIRGELPPEGERLFRLAQIERLPEVELESKADHSQAASARSEIMRLLNELLEQVAPRRAQALDAQPFANLDDATFVNGLCQSLEFSAAEKQGLLEADGTRERFARLASLIRFRLAELRAGGSSDPNVLQ